MTKRALLYSRTSYADREQISHASQLDLCRQHAQGRGYAIVAELSEDDSGVSGADFDAPELNRALTLAEQGAFDVLVARDNKRFARSVLKHEMFKHQLKLAGAAIEYALLDIQDTDEGTFLDQVLAAAAELDRKDITKRLARGRDNAVRRGNVMAAGHAPYGYRQVENDGRRTLVIHEDDAQWVRYMYQYYGRGDQEKHRPSIRDLVRKLSAAGVPTSADQGRSIARKKVKRGQWNMTSVRWILNNTAYIGRWTYNASDGSELVVEIPPIVDRPLWDAVQRRLEQNKRLARRNVKHQYLLRGRIYCGRCGYRMQGRTLKRPNKTYQYYRCGATDRRSVPAVVHCDASRVRVDKLDQRTWQLLLDAFSDPAGLRDTYARHADQALQASAGTLQRLERLEAQIESERAKLARLLDLYLDGQATQEILAQRQAQIEARLAEQNDERRRLEARHADASPAPAHLDTLVAFADQMREELDSLDFDGRQRAIDQLDITVTVTDHTATVETLGFVLGVIDCD